MTRAAAPVSVIDHVLGGSRRPLSWQEVHDLLTLEGPPLELAPRYNVVPGQNIAAVRLEPDGRRLAMLRWGLIPGWAGDPAIAYRLINARGRDGGVEAFVPRRVPQPALPDSDQRVL